MNDELELVGMDDKNKDYDDSDLDLEGVKTMTPEYAKYLSELLACDDSDQTEEAWLERDCEEGEDHDD